MEYNISIKDNKKKHEECYFINLIEKISKNRLKFSIEQNKNEKEKKAVINKIIYEEYTELFELMVNSEYLLKNSIEEDVIKIISDQTKHLGTTSWATNFLRTNNKTNTYNLVVEAFNKKMQNPNTIKSTENCLDMINHFSKFANKHISTAQQNKLSIQLFKSFLENKEIQSNILASKKNINKIL